VGRIRTNQPRPASSQEHTLAQPTPFTGTETAAAGGGVFEGGRRRVINRHGAAEGTREQGNGKLNSHHETTNLISLGGLKRRFFQKTLSGLERKNLGMRAKGFGEGDDNIIERVRS